MSLRARLALAIAGAALAILCLGAVLFTLQAERRIAEELDAARRVAENGIARVIGELPASPRPQSDLESFVRTLNGDRHVRLLMVDAFGIVRMQSALAEPDLAVPPVLLRWLSPPQDTTLLPLPPNAAPIVAAMLVVVPVNEVAEVWSDLLLNLALLAVFLAIALVFVTIVVGRALRPLGDLADAFHRIGRGDYAHALTPRGPPEIAALQAACNDMAGRLGAADGEKRCLSEQLLRLQDEERAALARDLHDDVGPFLFAIDVDAAAIAATAESEDANGAAEAGERAAAIRQAAKHARLALRRILGTLRPGLASGIGLKAALDHLVAGCRARHPDVAFRLDVDEEDLGALLEDLLLRVLREAVNNALRHGRPDTVRIAVRIERARVVFSVVDDGGGFAAPGQGFGLLGMRERVAAAGGRLSVAEIGLPPGVSVSGELPWRADASLDPAPAAMRPARGIGPGPAKRAADTAADEQAPGDPDPPASDPPRDPAAKMVAA